MNIIEENAVMYLIFVNIYSKQRGVGVLFCPLFANIVFPLKNFLYFQNVHLITVIIKIIIHSRIYVERVVNKDRYKRTSSTSV